MSQNNLICFLLIFPNLSPVSAIIGGTPAEFYPFFVLVPKDDDVCGGVVVETNIVLTAARCLYRNRMQRWAAATDVYVLLGNFSVPQQWEARYFQAENYIVHGEYNQRLFGGKGSHDLALIKVEEDFRLFAKRLVVLKPCCFNAYKPEYMEGVAIGMGLISQQPNTRAEQLMEVALIRDPKCAGLYETNRAVKRNHLCYSNPGSGTCKGDSGGPLVFKARGQVACILGISSFEGDSHGRCDIPSVFTPATVFRNWIEKKIVLLKNTPSEELLEESQREFPRNPELYLDASPGSL